MSRNNEEEAKASNKGIMGLVIISMYISLFLITYYYITSALANNALPDWLKLFLRPEAPYYCGIFGGIGGAIYCMRGIYLNYCVYKQWDSVWYPWYFIRPIVSIVTGVVSFFLLRAGLFVLESKTNTDSSYYGYYAFAFIAGYNVDQFLKKVEDIAQTTWGIDKSRSSKNDTIEENKSKGKDKANDEDKTKSGNH